MSGPQRVFTAREARTTPPRFPLTVRAGSIKERSNGEEGGGESEGEKIA